MSSKLTSESVQGNLFQKFTKLIQFKRPKLSVLMMFGFFSLSLILLISSFQGINVFKGITVQAADCVWTGNNSGDFSDSGNWSACPTGSGVPENNDKAFFPSSANEYNLNNDLNITFGAFVVEPLTNSNYVLGGNTLNSNESLDTNSGGSYNFVLQVDSFFCGLNGSGRITIDFGYRLTSNCSSVGYIFSGLLEGDGTYERTGSGFQNFTGATTGSNLTIITSGYFLVINPGTQINGPYQNNNGGTLVDGGEFNGSVTHAGGGFNFYSTSSGFDFNGGFDFDPNYVNNLGFDMTSNTSYGRINITSGNTILSDATVSMRFFNSYNVGDQYTIVRSSNGGSISGEFSDLGSGNTAVFPGWTNAGITKSVVVSLDYTGSTVVATILSITDLSCSGINSLSTNTGNFASFSNLFGPTNYLANSNCKWTISPTNADSVTLNFSSFNTENSNDIVRVYDGLSTFDTLLGEFSGNSIPSSVTSSTGIMLVTFTSNATIEASGFQASWTSTRLLAPIISDILPISGPVAGGTSVTVNGSNFAPGQYQSIQSVGNTGYDGSRGLVVDSTGQYISGEFSDSITLGSTTLTSSGDTDIYVAKLDLNGNYVWAVKAGGFSQDGFTRRQAMANNPFDNSLILGGYYATSADFGATTLNGDTGSNIFIAKVDKSNGDFIWAKSAGGSTNVILDGNLFPEQVASSVTADSAGNVYASGSVSTSDAYFDGIGLPQVGAGGGEIFVAKLDSDGNFIWANRYGDSAPGGGGNKAHGLVVDTSGDVYAAFALNDSMVVGNTTLTSFAGTDGNSVVVKLDSSGTEIWAVSGGTVGPTNIALDLAYDLGLDSTGNLYLTGYIGGQNGTFGSINVIGSATGSAAYTAKLNPSNGNFVWVETLASPGLAIGRDMLIDSSDNIWIGGVYFNVMTDGNSTITGNATNAFFARYNSSGGLQEIKSIGGTAGQIGSINTTGVGGNQVRALAQYNDKLYIAGEYFDTIGIGGQSITSNGNQDGFYTNWVSNTVSVKIGGIEVPATFNSSNQLTFVTPPNTAGFKDVIVTNSNGVSYNLVGGYEYISTTSEVTNSDISSMACTPTTAPVNTTVNCIITTGTNLNSLTGSVNVRIGTGGTIINCPVIGSGTSLACNNIPVGSTATTLASQYNASGSGTTYLNGNDIIVTSGSNPEVINSDITSMACTPTTTPVNTTVNCTITTSTNINLLGGSVNVKIGDLGTVINCPVLGSGNSVTCNNVPAGNTVGVFTSKYNASGSGNTYLNGNDITVIAGSNAACGAITSTLDCAIIDLSVTGGSLTIDTPTSASLQGLAVAPIEILTTGSVPNVNILDLRGNYAGWNSFCTITNFTGANTNYVIPLLKDTTSKYALTPSSLRLTQTDSGRLNDGTLVDNTSLQTTTSYTSGVSNAFSVSGFSTGGGQGWYEKDLGMELNIPPFVRTDNYNATMTCSVS